ncbi:RNA chaperone Hfq [Staphylococcus devriesei]|uniref:RNA-binding protein Hfq n=1 Tax=Staphylococcus devriesei TaxID=586733 RepID=A0A2K4DPL2_9STAP|nr:RNA chaperone Hfq [Staphylococcus devriesei]MCE5089576.1 RNA chaperone Hfq [Staphylococcus devriesei]MCE5096175.1 RNA chaperone Hfq [Staphylococcus devriesei]PNZ88749.1 RNA chaperone Hfq [Staphylococcus devriesei]PTE73586.1 RNA chaperone Hfq [Staphylococcus devriesei]PTF04090.1 RNA chaperone Hfq [Staphylococcus devriesei]
MIANHNIQDQALENFKADKVEITVFFLNGFQMKGVIEDFDKYVISLVSQGKQHLIYKHAISTFTVDTETADTEETVTSEE